MPIVLFDIDMTLVRTNGAGRAAMDAALAEAYGVASPTEGIAFDGRTDRAIFLDALHRLGDATPQALQRLVAGYLQRLPGELERRGGDVLPGVLDLLARLEHERVPLGLATGNMRAGAQFKLAHFDLWRRFLGGGFGDHVVVRSELVSAAIVELSAIAGGPGPQPCVVVGDTPLDIEAAHAAGARAIGVATGRYTTAELAAAGADLALPDLSAVDEVITFIHAMANGS